MIAKSNNVQSYKLSFFFFLVPKYVPNIRILDIVLYVQTFCSHNLGNT